MLGYVALAKMYLDIYYIKQQCLIDLFLMLWLFVSILTTYLADLK